MASNIGQHFVKVLNLTHYTTAATDESVLKSDWKRIATFAPYGIGAGLVVGGLVGTAIGVHGQKEEETRKQAAWRGAKKGMTWGAITGMVIGVAGHPPLSLINKVKDKTTKDVANNFFRPGDPGFSEFVERNVQARRVGAVGEMLESAGLIGGTVAAKTGAMLETRKLEATDDPKEQRKIKNWRAALNIISMYLSFRFVSKRGRNLDDNFDFIRNTRFVDIAALPVSVPYKLMTSTRDVWPTIKESFRAMPHPPLP